MATFKIIKKEIIDTCLGDFDIRYALCEQNGEIYAAYYEPRRRQLKVAKRDASGKWHYALLPEYVNWDSHRYISMIVDHKGYIHLAANMHNHPLAYYRSERPGEIGSIKKEQMTGEMESKVTYPEFLSNNRRLYFHYREGRSGNGNTFINLYDDETQKWTKLSAQPLFDGKGLMNAYFKGPFAAPDNRFLLVWCWRDTPHCETNHGLYFASSADLHTWQTLSGFSQKGSITPEDAAFLVDDIKAGEGLINGGYALSTVPETGMPVVAYHKYDENDCTNLYIAFWNAGKWESRRITDWHWKWNFSGKGSIPFLLDITGVSVAGREITVYFSKVSRKHFFSPKKLRHYAAVYDTSTASTREMEILPYPAEIISPAKKKHLVHIEQDRTSDTAQKGNRPYSLMRYETGFPARDKKSKHGNSLSRLEWLLVERQS